jgi:hypothetical protein
MEVQFISLILTQSSWEFKILYVSAVYFSDSYPVIMRIWDLINNCIFSTHSCRDVLLCFVVVVAACSAGCVRGCNSISGTVLCSDSTGP